MLNDENLVLSIFQSLNLIACITTSVRTDYKCSIDKDELYETDFVGISLVLSLLFCSEYDELRQSIFPAFGSCYSMFSIFHF